MGIGVACESVEWGESRRRRNCEEGEAEAEAEGGAGELHCSRGRLVG
jgi:hypothetical protein